MTHAPLRGRFSPHRVDPVDHGEAAAWLRAGSIAAAIMALAGYAGALGLLGGGIEFGRYHSMIVQRIPFHSLPLAGVGLLIAVAAPMTVAAVTAWRRLWLAPWALQLAGAALVVWIIVEVALVRVYSWMQPFCIISGLAVAALGGLATRRSAR